MTGSEYATKLFGQLDTLERRYRRFMHRATFAIALLIASNLLFLFVALPQKAAEIQESRRAVILQACEDEKLLLSIVPPGYPLPRVPSDSALNPRRDCAEFAARATR